MSDAAFDLEAITKSYRVGEGSIEILHNIDLKIRQGSYVAIMGPSGSGKSTLLQLLGCLDLPTSGRLSVMGQEISRLSDDEISALRARSLGFVFQQFNLLPAYDAVSNVALAMVYGGRLDGRARAAEILTALGMGHRLYHRPSMMSGGEQQRVAIARAAANDSPIILADEPTGSLDQENGKAVLALLAGFHRRGKTVIMVTHDPHVAAHAERVIEIVDGRIGNDRRLSRSSR